jgi:hypothetical protein
MYEFLILNSKFLIIGVQEGLAAGGDPKVGRPGMSGRQFGQLADGSKERLTVQPAGGVPSVG